MKKIDITRNSSGYLAKTIITFSKKRAELLEKYDKDKKALEVYKGSPYYVENAEALEKKLQQDLKALKAETFASTDINIKRMRDANRRNGAVPPTGEQIALIKIIKERDSWTESELESMAIACRDNDLCLKVIQDAARAAGIIGKNYLAYYDGEKMTFSRVEHEINSMIPLINDYIEHETTPAARAAHDFAMTHYGEDARPLRRRSVIETESQFFNELTTVTPDELSRFRAVVDSSTV